MLSARRIMKHVCPKCDVAMLILSFESIEIDHCTKCRGIWLDAGELEELLHRTGANAGDPLLQFQKLAGVAPTGRSRLCPRCDQRLREIRVNESLTIDRCPVDHGLWFDADELTQLLEMFTPEAGTTNTINYLSEILGLSLKGERP